MTRKVKSRLLIVLYSTVCSFALSLTHLSAASALNQGNRSSEAHSLESSASVESAPVSASTPFKGTSASPGTTDTTPVVPVTGLEVERYLGRWYDVRSIPNSFQRGCTNTTADYAVDDHDTLSVVNQCDKVNERGEWVELEVAEGKAWIKNSDNSVLKVSFACLFGYCFERFGGDYWVLGLGPINSEGLYSWAIVGTPSREFGWVLSREKNLDEATWTEIELLLRRQGYDPAGFATTIHNK